MFCVLIRIASSPEISQNTIMYAAIIFFLTDSIKCSKQQWQTSHQCLIEVLLYFEIMNIRHIES